MATGLMKLPENRVRRNYTGGAGIDRLHGKARQEDNNMPEEWVGSMVEASNPGMEPIAHEVVGLFLPFIYSDMREVCMPAMRHKSASFIFFLIVTALNSR